MGAGLAAATAIDEQRPGMAPATAEVGVQPWAALDLKLSLLNFLYKQKYISKTFIISRL